MFKPNGIDNMLNMNLIMYLYWILSLKAWYGAWIWLNY